MIKLAWNTMTTVCWPGGLALDEEERKRLQAAVSVEVQKHLRQAPFLFRAGAYGLSIACCGWLLIARTLRISPTRQLALWEQGLRGIGRSHLRLVRSIVYLCTFEHPDIRRLLGAATVIERQKEFRKLHRQVGDRS